MSALDNFLKDKRSELSELKKKRRKLKGSEVGKLDEPIQDLEDLVRRFRKSNMEPRQVGDIIINYKLYDRFVKKLKGYMTKVTIKEDRLLLQYGKNYGNWTGSLELHDLSDHFEGYADVSKAIIDE